MSTSSTATEPGLTRRRLTEHVYACEQSRAGLGFSNSGLVSAGGGLVVDTLYDLALTREMARLYAEVQPDAPARIVNTHHNGDHTWGNQCFPDAEIIGHHGCVERFAEVQPASVEAIRTMAEAPEPVPAAAVPARHRADPGAAARMFDAATTRRRSVVFEEDDELDVPDFLK